MYIEFVNKVATTKPPPHGGVRILNQMFHLMLELKTLSQRLNNILLGRNLRVSKALGGGGDLPVANLFSSETSEGELV